VRRHAIGGIAVAKSLRTSNAQEVPLW